MQLEIIIYGLVRKCVRLSPFSLTIFLSDSDRQIVGIPRGTHCAPLVADLFLFCNKRDFMLSLSHDNQSEVIKAFNSTSRYLDDLLNIDQTSLIAWSIIFTLQNFRTCQIPRPYFWIYIYLYRMILVRLKF